MRLVLIPLAASGLVVALNVGAESAQTAPGSPRSKDVATATKAHPSREHDSRSVDTEAPTQPAAKSAEISRTAETESVQQMKAIQRAKRHPDRQPLVNAQGKSARPSVPSPGNHTPAFNPKDGLPTSALHPQPNRAPQPALSKMPAPVIDALHTRNTAPAGIGGPTAIAKNHETLTGLNGTGLKHKP